MKLESKNITNLIQYYHLGLGGSHRKNDKGWELDSLQGLIKRAGDNNVSHKSVNIYIINMIYNYNYNYSL